jgi:hypothetical protein
MISRLERWLAAVEQTATLLALGLMLAIMLVVTGDVLMRYLFNRPFTWAYDLIALYLMAGAFFFVLSDAYRVRAHVCVVISYRNLDTHPQVGASRSLNVSGDTTPAISNRKCQQRGRLLPSRERPARAAPGRERLASRCDPFATVTSAGSGLWRMSTTYAERRM